MKTMLILEALSFIPDEMVMEAANEAAARTAVVSYRKHIRRLILVAVLAALALLTLISCGVYRMIQDSPIYNTKPFTYHADPTDTPEDAALVLAEMYMEDLMVPSDERTYYITQYRNLSVTLHETTELWKDEIAIGIWNLQKEEIGRNKWIVQINVEFQYEGTLSPLGPSDSVPDDYWVESLSHHSAIDFLLVRNIFGTYSLQSRYITAWT